MRADDWDDRYRGSDLVWGAEPNRWVEEFAMPLAPGHAVDLACGEGRNAIWLALRGWIVTGVDFSVAGLDKAERLAARAEVDSDRLRWICASVETVDLAPTDLAVVAYLQVEAAARRAALVNAASAVRPGGHLLVVAHDTRNLTEGVGGPQDLAVLYAPHDVVTDLAGSGLEIVTAETRERDVVGSAQPALDVVVQARRPGTP